MPTLTLYRQDVSRALGDYQQGTALAGSTTVLLNDTTATLRSSIASAKLYEDWWIFRPTAALAADKVRRVAVYDPIAGTLTPDLAWTNAPAAAEVYELHGTIEPLTDMANLINTALLRCYVEQETTLTPVVLQSRHSLATKTWIDAEWKVRAVGVLGPNLSRELHNPYLERPVRGTVVNDGGTWYLVHPGYSFQTTDTLYVQTISDGWHQCAATGGAYGTQSGLSLETDISPIAVTWLTPAVLMEFYIRTANIIDRQSNQRLGVDQSQIAARFTSERVKYFTLPTLRFLPLYPLGPRYGGLIA